MPFGHVKQLAAAFALGASLGAPAAALANPVLLFEPDTGRVLYAEEPDRIWHPASVTKLMTAYLTFEAVKAGALAWDGDVPLSDHARNQPATRIGLRGGIKLNVEQAVRGLILRSANDFAVALAERVSGSEGKFVDAMNATAKRLGMTRTVFRNPHGLPDAEQVTTARDLALLTSALLKDFPERAEVFSTPTVRIHKGTFHSQNDLLRSLAGADGLKTGFTCASGYNVVASATRDGRRLVAIVLGAVSRQQRSERAVELLEFGFVGSAPPGPAASKVSSEVVQASAAASTVVHTSDQLKAFAPVALTDLAMSPVTDAGPADLARLVRNGKCRGSAGFVKMVPEPGVEATRSETATSVAVPRTLSENPVSLGAEGNSGRGQALRPPTASGASAANKPAIRSAKKTAGKAASHSVSGAPFGKDALREGDAQTQR